MNLQHNRRRPIPSLLLVCALSAHWPVPASRAQSTAPADAGANSTQSSPVPDSPPPKFHLEGIVHNVFQYEDLHDKPDNFTMNTTRATVRVSGELASKFEYKVGAVARLHTGTKQVDNVPFLSPRLRETIVPGAGVYLESSIASDVFVQEAYATLRLSGLYIRAGRQKIQNGTGYAYNPTDLFNRRVPLDPTYEADGYDALAAGWVFSPGTQVELLVRPRNEPAYRARFQSAWHQADLAVQFTSIVRSRIDWQEVNTPASVERLDAGAATVDDFGRDFRWNQLSTELSRVVHGVRLYGEAGIAFIDQPPDPGTLGPDSKTHERLLVGADYLFPSGVRVILEYMRLGEGRASAQLQSLNDQVASFKGETLSADKNNGYLELSRPFPRGFSGSLKVVVW